MRVGIYVSGTPQPLVVFCLIGNVASVESGADLRTTHEVVHDVLAHHCLTPQDGLPFLHALEHELEPDLASAYGALTAIRLAS